MKSKNEEKKRIDKQKEELQKKTKYTETKNYLVPNGTTNLMMWIGGALPNDKKVLWKNKTGKPTYCNNGIENSSYDFAYVDYVATLQGECKKMEQNGEACIFVYDGKMMNNEEEQKMKNIVKNIPNCYLVDYEKYIENISKNELTFKKGNQEVKQSDFIKHIDSIIMKNQKQKIFNGNLTRESIGNLVDCMRMLLLLHTQTLKKIAKENNPEKEQTLLKEDDFCMLYRDLDVIKNENIENTSTNINTEKKLIEHSFVCCDNMNGIGKSKKDKENGILFVNSRDDRNNTIEDIIINYLTNTSSISMFRVISKKNICVNNFTKQFTDEGHRSWRIKDLQKTQTNTNNRQPTFELPTNFNICNYCDCDF